MRNGEGYLAKLWPEMDVFKEHLFHGTSLSYRDQKTWEQIDFARAEILAGHSQYQVLTALKNTYKIQERRSREVLWMVYNIFADLGLNQNEAGKKYVFENIFMEAGQKAIKMVDAAMDDGDPKSAAAFLKIYKEFMKEAAMLAGAYNKAIPGGIDPAQYERPVEVSFVLKSGVKKQLNVETGEITEVVDVETQIEDEQEDRIKSASVGFSGGETAD